MQKDNLMLVVWEDVVQPDVTLEDNDSKTFLVPLQRVPTENIETFNKLIKINKKNLFNKVNFPLVSLGIKHLSTEL